MALLNYYMSQYPSILWRMLLLLKITSRRAKFCHKMRGSVSHSGFGMWSLDQSFCCSKSPGLIPMEMKQWSHGPLRSHSFQGKPLSSQVRVPACLSPGSLLNRAPRVSQGHPNIGGTCMSVNCCGPEE